MNKRLLRSLIILYLKESLKNNFKILSTGDSNILLISITDISILNNFEFYRLV